MKEVATMEFRLSPELEAFRAEVTEFHREQLGDLCWHGRYPDHWGKSLEFCEAMAQKGWIGLWWPTEYGGQAKPYSYQLVLLEELAYWEAPRGPVYIGWDRVAWSLLLLGTE